MGTYLCFSISNSITQKQWEKVYEETLFLADKLNLADWDKFYYKGIRSYAYCKVKEQTQKDYGKETHFWRTCGEYNYLRDGEYFRLDREIEKFKYNKNAGPAILSELDSYSCITSSPFDNQIRTRAIKTTGGLYHAKLLAILCFMESKLKEKMYICGDIDRGQCENAVQIANNYLKEPIELPARCNFKKLYKIVNSIELSENEKLKLMEKTYLGEVNLQYKNFIEEKFDKKTIKQFWKNRFKEYTVDDYKFKETLKEYLSYGFAVKDLFSYISFSNQRGQYLKFLELIIEIMNNMNQLTKTVGLTRNPKNNRVRGILPEFIHSLFGPDNSITISNYTFDDLVNEFSKYFGDQVDVKSFLKEKIKDEDDDSIILKVKKYLADDNYYIFKGEEKYDIIVSRALMYYKTNDKIAPYLMKDIKDALKTNKKRLADKEFTELQGKESTEQIYELIDIRKQFPARDIDWFHAIDYFNSHSDALERYYPLFHMKFEYFSSSEDIAKALFMNDEFYEYCMKL